MDRSNMFNKFLTSNEPFAKGVRTVVQAVLGLVTGLALTVWGVPGVPEAVTKYLTENALQLLSVAGLSAGLISWVWNEAGKHLKK